MASSIVGKKISECLRFGVDLTYLVFTGFPRAYRAHKEDCSLVLIIFELAQNRHIVILERRFDV